MYVVFTTLAFIFCLFQNVFQVAGQPQNEIKREREKPPYKPLLVQVNEEGKLVDYSSSLNFQTTTKYLCPNPILEEDSHSQAMKNRRYCLSEMKLESTSQTETGHEPRITCSEEVEPFIIPVEPEEKCGIILEGEQDGKMYQFVFYVCNANENRYEYQTIYKFCLNPNILEVLYTWHKIWTPSLLKSNPNFNELTKYQSNTKSTEGYGILGDTIKEIENMLDEEIDQNIPTGMLVPPGDLIFGNWKKAAYHLLNVKTLDETVEDYSNHINERIRQAAITMNAEFEIFSKVLQSKNTDLNRVEIISIKIVYLRPEKKGVTIIVFDQFVPDKLCEQEKDCFGGALSSWIKCCEITRHHLNNIFGIKLELKMTDGYLKLDLDE